MSAPPLLDADCKLKIDRTARDPHLPVRAAVLARGLLWLQQILQAGAQAADGLAVQLAHA